MGPEKITIAEFSRVTGWVVQKDLDEENVLTPNDVVRPQRDGVLQRAVGYDAARAEYYRKLLEQKTAPQTSMADAPKTCVTYKTRATELMGKSEALRLYRDKLTHYYGEGKYPYTTEAFVSYFGLAQAADAAEHTAAVLYGVAGSCRLSDSQTTQAKARGTCEAAPYILHAREYYRDLSAKQVEAEVDKSLAACAALKSEAK